jgi:hypothetical protein
MPTKNNNHATFPMTALRLQLQVAPKMNQEGMHFNKTESDISAAL